MLVSVVIPAFNREKYIKEAIQTVLDQRLPKGWSMEVIVVDDGSTDNTLSVLKKFGNKITVYSIPHSGKPAVARNYGITHSKGELISFQDSDDRWTPKRLGIQIPYFEDPDIIMVHGQAEIISEAGEPTGHTVTESIKKPQITTFETLAASNIVSTLTVTIRRTALETLNGFDESDSMRGIEDYHLWLRAATLEGKKMLQLPEVLANYRQHDQNISNLGFGETGSAEYEAKALQRINDVLQKVLLEHHLTAHQSRVLESQVDQHIDGIFNFRNPAYSMRNPKISVILPMYNAEKYVRETLDSILAQTFRDFEVIAIDDGSNDTTAAIVASYTDPRIKLFRQKNRGLVATLNRGVRLCRGQYIARHDSDDISLPSRFEKQYTFLASNNDVGLVSCFFTYFSADENAENPTITNPYQPLDVHRSLFLLNPIAHGGVLARKSIFDANHPYKEEYLTAEDYHMWCSFAERTKLAIIPETLYLYRLNPEGISSTKYDLALETTAKIISEQWQKPFPLKSFRTIVSDATYYSSYSGQFSPQVKQQYISQQYHLALGLIRKGWLRPAVLQSAAAIRLNKKSVVLVKPIVKLTLRKLGHRLGL